MYILDEFQYLKDDDCWFDGNTGHCCSTLAPDGSILTVYGNYSCPGMCLIKWLRTRSDAILFSKRFQTGWKLSTRFCCLRTLCSLPFRILDTGWLANLIAESAVVWYPSRKYGRGKLEISNSAGNSQGSQDCGAFDEGSLLGRLPSRLFGAFDFAQNAGGPGLCARARFCGGHGRRDCGTYRLHKGGGGLSHGERTEALIFGPLSVRPDQQGRGVGSLLVRHSLKRAAGLGYKGVFIFGNPGYYGRFGFQNAERFGVTTREGENFDAFMGLELFPGGLKGVAGKFYEDPVFTVSEEDVAAFDRGFPFKEKHVTDTQLPG